MSEIKEVVSREYMGVVPQELFSKWRLHWRAGHNKLIISATKLSEPTVVNALRHGKATKETIKLIDKFYNKYIKSLS